MARATWHAVLEPYATQAATLNRLRNSVIGLLHDSDMLEAATLNRCGLKDVVIACMRIRGARLFQPNIFEPRPASRALTTQP